MAKRKSNKIDLLKKRAIELQKIIDEQSVIFNKKKLRKELLVERLETEKCRLDLFYLSKIFENIPIYINPKLDLFGIRDSYKTVRLDIKDDNKIYPELCCFEIDENCRSFKPRFIIRYGYNFPQNFSWEIEKLKYILLIFERLNIFEEEWASKRIKINEKYHNFIKKINVYEYENFLNKVKNELKIINDNLKLEVGLKYVFDDFANHFYGKIKKFTKNSKVQKIKSIEILKTTPVYCFYRVEIACFNFQQLKYEVKEVKEYRDKKCYVLKLLSENKHKLDLISARKKKLENILEKTN